jgi:hypothetical protein
MSSQNPAAQARPNYAERVEQQQAVVDALAADYKKKPTPELKEQLLRKTDTLLHLKSLAKGNPKERARQAANKALIFTLGKAVATPGIDRSKG